MRATLNVKLGVKKIEIKSKRKLNKQGGYSTSAFQYRVCVHALIGLAQLRMSHTTKIVLGLRRLRFMLAAAPLSQKPSLVQPTPHPSQKSKQKQT